MTSPFQGIFTPLVTPIGEDGSPDSTSIERLVDFQLSHRIDGFWVMGTSAEFAAFTESERTAVISTVVARTRGRVPVIANISDASTRTAIVHGLAAAAAGADAVAATPPYYYPHSQDELLDHYHAIRQAVDRPLFIYNIPQTVRVRVELNTAATLVEDGTVVGVKDSQNDLEWFRALTRFATAHGGQFSAFAGTRYLIDAAILAGACGAIPSIANAFPSLAVDAYQSSLTGDFAHAAECEGAIMDIEAIPLGIPAGSRNAALLGFLKTVLHARGIISLPALTAPLRSLRSAERERALSDLDNLLTLKSDAVIT